ncbi:riboflavin synthase subunit alpha [Candidatus Peribacteria bacterium RIFCSPLOWO2_01_FULL_51_18]|nr:MAG: riboflavin synthase subunit alpha [Candidatus Peribacteria bacterium RIFCSPHIGHO2_02_FULL_51_15]OGJ65297.1 MAG: riboflavin synthase subunit alpha [Candidatus Peribacteria bacterium RIFCSPLOWO2_01_FULL_51_18]
MFTGIIEATAEVVELKGGKLTVKRPKLFKNLLIGSSIAVSGVCLTVTAKNPKTITFDVVDTTIRKSKLGSLKPGDRVNLERAMPSGGRFDGHIVLGHAEGAGTIFKIGKIMVVSIPKDLQKFVIRHGSVTVDGVSLTVADFTDGKIYIALVPHTLKNTSFRKLKPGQKVNLETDVLGRYILSGTDDRA